MNRTAVVALLLLSLATLPGCIAYEIRDELATTNKQLDQLKALRGTINELQQKALAQLDQANMLLVETNSRLVTVNEQLDRVDALLTKTDDQLQTLETIDESLVSLDKQLLAVKGLVEALSGVMSLFGSDKAKEGEEGAEGHGAEGHEGQPGSDQPGAERQTDEKQRDADEAPERRQSDLPNQPAPKD